MSAAARTVSGYALIRRLGTGAMGEVWLGRHVDTSGLAAIKLLRDGSRDRVRHYFDREGRAVGRLAHPHIVPIYDFGDDYIINAYIDGGDLARKLREPMPASDAIRMVVQIAAALSHAHARGVVHRDVKPSNILLDSRGNAFLADFGLAVIFDDGRPEQPFVPAGTPAFMAPEQRHGEVSPAADQHALGRTLLAMLLGVSAPAATEQALAQLSDATPLALRDVIIRATAAEPAARYSSVAELAEALVVIDDCEVTAATSLAAAVRPEKPYAWATGAHDVLQIPPDLTRATYRLRDLAAAGQLPHAAVDALLGRHGLRDLGFAVYARKARLGSITDAAAWARAAEAVVLLHGLYVPRDTWSEGAAAICRDNAEAIVIVLDTVGHGDARFDRSRPDRASADLQRWMATVRELLRLLAISELPMVLVGHSMMGSTLMVVNDEELGPRVSRIAINPVWPEDQKLFTFGLRLQLVAHALLRPLGPLARWIVGALLASSPQTRELSRPLRRRIVDSILAMSTGALRGLSRSLSRLPMSPGPHRRLQVIYGLFDPVVPAAASTRGLDRLGLGAGQVQRLVSASHFPQLQLEPHPGHAARNIDEIVRAVDRLLLSAREGTSLSTETASTELESPGPGHLR